MKPEIIVITGTTATGKTKLAIIKAKELGGELISADSRQAYRHLDIITGKDLIGSNFQLQKTLAPHFQLGYHSLESVPVWLYDILDPREYLSAFDWALCAKAVLKILFQKQKTPILVGGSYFYLQTLLYGLADGGTEANWPLRERLGKLSVFELQEQLKKLNEQTFNQLNPSDRYNKRRLIRRIEKLQLTKATSRPSLDGIAANHRIEFIGLEPENKQELTERIRLRVCQRIEQGAVDEIELLLRMGYSRDDPGLQTIGYKQLLDYLNNKTSLEQAQEEWIKKEVQYARRQLTFMKKNPEIRWQTM